MGRVEIACSDYWDFPRVFITRWRGKVILFDGHFDDIRDDYDDHFAVYELPLASVEHLSDRYLADLASEGKLVGRISVKEVKFPGKDKRRWSGGEPPKPGTKARLICWMDDEIFKKLGLDKGRESLNLKARIRRMASKQGSIRPTVIKIIKQGDDLDDLYTAEVTTPQGTWRLPYPMPGDELGRKLLSLGHDKVKVRNALHAAGVGYFPETIKLARKTRPLLQAALAVEREVPKQEPHTEAWLAYALPKSDMMLSLIQVISNAEFIMDVPPTADEVSWAFLRLRRRGWLVVEGDMYGLTPEAKRIVKEIENDHSRWPRKLVNWMSEHPLPGDE